MNAEKFSPYVLKSCHIPVFSEAAMSGDTKHLRLYILSRELLCWDRINFMLERETKCIFTMCAAVLALSYSKSVVETLSSPEGTMQLTFVGGSLSCEKAAKQQFGSCCPLQHSGTKSCKG